MSTPYYGPPQGPPQEPWPTQSYGALPPAPVRRRRRGWLIAAVAVVVLGVAGGATAWVLLAQYKDIEPAKIRALTDDFSKAVATGNPQKIAGYMCADEAEPYLENTEIQDGDAQGPKDSGFEIDDITVKGDVASATLKFRESESQQLYFRKENGKWTVCEPAKNQM